MKDMRDKAAATAEHLWDVIQDAMAHGVTFREFVAEVAEGYQQVHRDAAVEVEKEAARMLRR